MARRTQKFDTVLSLPAEVVTAAEAVLAPRGLSVETYVAMHLRTLARVKSILDLPDTMPFGKYRGETVENTCRADPTYMDWLIAQPGKAKFDPAVTRLIDQLLLVEKQRPAAKE